VLVFDQLEQVVGRLVDLDVLASMGSYVFVVGFERFVVSWDRVGCNCSPRRSYAVVRSIVR